jgi:hypothetical protein
MLAELDRTRTSSKLARTRCPRAAHARGSRHDVVASRPSKILLVVLSLLAAQQIFFLANAAAQPTET